MKVHVYEKAFLSVGAGLLVVFMGVLLYASLGMGIHLPGRAGRIDPRAVSSTPPFDAPGVHRTGANSYDVVMIGHAWAFNPTEVRVPVGAEITFIVTSIDVVHGFNVERTRVNLMLVPGQISRTVYTFREPGEYLIVCHEFCGIGHHYMVGKVIAE
jgi:cytochrome c oxidase subunit II